MKAVRLTILCTQTLFLLAAADPFVGTWKLNTYKSKFPAEAPGFFSGTVQVEAAGPLLKSTTSSADDEGLAGNFTFNCTLDGTPCKVTSSIPLRGPSSADTITLKRTSPNTITATGTRNGKLVYSDRRSISADGQMMTVLRNGTTPQGKKYESTIILERLH